MKRVHLKTIVNAAAAAACVLLLLISTAYADTDGTELQVEKPAQLEIQLGPEWSGINFQLRTDAGIYPGIITVNEAGIPIRHIAIFSIGIAVSVCILAILQFSNGNKGRMSLEEEDSESPD